MQQKILRVSAKIVARLFLLYLALGLVIFPLVLWWAIPSQATKILKTPVHLRWVTFNPILPRLTLHGFTIVDNQQQVMVGFDKLSVRVSFLGLLKKTIHVQALELDGLKINAELLQGNKVNLLALVPPGIMPVAQPKRPAAKAQQPAASAGKPAALPQVIVDTMTLHQGQVHFTDRTIKPNFSATMDSMEMLVTNVTTNPQDQAKIKFQCDLDDKGRITMETVIRPLARPLEMESTMSLNDYALRVLTPYIGKYTGHELKSGQLDLTMDYRISGNKLVADHKLLIQEFKFGSSVDSKDALHLPFGLALALLEDPDGKMRINLPVTGDMSDPKFQYSHLVFQVVRNFFFNLITKPFSFLGSSLGLTQTAMDELGYVRFSPGLAALSVSQQQKLFALIKGLRQHPKLRLEIDGSYDPQSDWKAIQASVFTRDYAQLRKEFTGPDSKVYQLLYQRRFGIRALWALAKRYKEGIGRYDDAKLDAEIKRQLIENAPPDREALGTLAQARARLVYQFLVLNGFDAKHLHLGPSQSTQGSMGYVPLPFTLTVFGQN